ncbi:heparan-alpha-glucosaminide N-acetyltransferase-like isoform X1 [Centruroides sculpturatus]|uniref:heparan-alpha-glucosaminide N-acetyltransferase-like isoform X1 n=2 Tax=Centruroides sculpturatus TaxID=218467 RepID=UPI000C6E6C09|nr:heparan-alpha-glucosaminide N-acetyltransferase-like isoform X1 [Centruroides sculpturatus]
MKKVFFIYLTCLLFVSCTDSPFNDPNYFVYFHSLDDNLMKMGEQSKKMCEKLEMNECCFTVRNEYEKDIKVFMQSEECYKCNLLEQMHIPPGSEDNITINVEFGRHYEIEIVSENFTKLCKQEFQEGGMYALNFTGNWTVCSDIKTTNKLHNIYLPLLYAFLVYLSIAILWIVGKYLYKRYFHKLLKRDSIEVSSEELNAGLSNSVTQVSQAGTKKRRLRSLDTFRGLSIVIMIFVNYGGGGYQFFSHAVWNGLTVADLVFPWFIWIMGVSMAFSLRSLLRRSTPRLRIFRKIVKRTLILFLLGLMLNTFKPEKTDLRDLRILGVLQRFSISYFVVATVHMFFAKPQDVCAHTKWAAVRDIVCYWMEWLIMLSLLAAHILLTFLLYVPGCGRGYLGPNGLYDHGKYEKCRYAGGAASYIDYHALTWSHMYQHPTLRKLYDPNNEFRIIYDPEGLLGCLTSIFLVFLGLQAGKILLTYKEWKPRVMRWMLWGILTGTVAAILCKCSKNDGWIPVNKNLWSVSFIMATGSMSFILLSICYIFCDVLNWWNGSPFFFPGMNSILLYVGHSMTGKMFPWAWAVENTHGYRLMINLWATSLWVLISIWLYHKKFFLAI